MTDLDGQTKAEAALASERADLQRTAQATGERFGRQDEAISNHEEHFRKLNGSISRIDDTMHTQATTLALLAASVAAIQKQLAQRDEKQVRRSGLSTQWLLAIFAAVIALGGLVITTVVTIVMTLVVLYANGKL